MDVFVEYGRKTALVGTISYSWLGQGEEGIEKQYEGASVMKKSWTKEEYQANTKQIWQASQVGGEEVTSDEHELFIEALQKYGPYHPDIKNFGSPRDHVQIKETDKQNKNLELSAMLSSDPIFLASVLEGSLPQMKESALRNEATPILAIKRMIANTHGISWLRLSLLALEVREWSKKDLLELEKFSSDSVFLEAIQKQKVRVR